MNNADSGMGWSAEVATSPCHWCNHPNRWCDCSRDTWTGQSGSVGERIDCRAQTGSSSHIKITSQTEGCATLCFVGQATLHWVQKQEVWWSSAIIITNCTHSRKQAIARGPNSRAIWQIEVCCAGLKWKHSTQHHSRIHRKNGGEGVEWQTKCNSSSMVSSWASVTLEASLGVSSSSNKHCSLNPEWHAITITSWWQQAQPFHCVLIICPSNLEAQHKFWPGSVQLLDYELWETDWQN